MKTMLAMYWMLLIATSAYAHVWPSGGASEKQLLPGSSVPVTWDNAMIVDRVTVELWDGERGLFRTIATGIPASQRRYEWVIPHDQQTGTLFRFVVRDHANPSIALFSSGFLSIVSPQPLVSGIRDETMSSSQIMVDPTPAVDKITVVWDVHDVELVEVRDLQGQLRWSRAVNIASTSLDVDVREFAPGMYTIIARAINGRSITKPFVVQR
ncbi:MAG: hypothetical protein NTX15_08670 [Candidatus Kapabacteria bacterium]|nr:hypothetical protein [Candidatus Kapabacteria bacterium]